MDDLVPVLMNSKAGGMHDSSAEVQLKKIANDAGLPIRVIKTATPEAFKAELAKIIHAKEPKVAIAGGDGTVALAVQELACTNTALGILSQGTFNNFASTLRLPHNLPLAMKALKNGKATCVDLGKVGDRYFTESCGIGIFADALALYGKGTNKNFFRGLYALTRLALEFRPCPVTLTLDGKDQTENVTICEVCNTYRIGQAAPIAPGASVTDGLLDIVVFSDLSRREVPEYMKALRAQMHLGLPKVKAFRAKEVTIRPGRRRNVHADDQVVGNSPVAITVVPGALKVLTDQEL